MFGWLFGGGKRKRRAKDPGWNHTNAFNFAKPSRAPRRGTGLDKCRAKVKRLEAIIKQKNNEIMQLKRINKAQQPMKDDVVNEGTYAYYQAGLKRIMALLNSRGDWADVMVPGIRREVNGMLGTNIEWDAKRRRGVRRR